MSRPLISSSGDARKPMVAFNALKSRSPMPSAQTTATTAAINCARNWAPLPAMKPLTP